MLEYNLTQRERQLLVTLLQLSRKSKDHFEAHLLTDVGNGPKSELARRNFGDVRHSMELTRRDRRQLKDEGLIHFRWNTPDRGTGRLTTPNSSAPSRILVDRLEFF